MADNAENKDTKKKALNLVLIGQIAFAVVNFAVVGGGAYLTYASTLGWQPPVITEEMLRAPAAVKKDDGKKDEKQASVGGGHGGAQAAAGGHGESVSGEIVTYINKLDKFTVNLAGEPKRSIRIEVNLELLNEKSYEESLDVGNLPRIRDRIVSVLNDKTFSDIESIQGKLFLKERIATEVNSILDEGVVKDVYFSEMVVQ